MKANSAKLKWLKNLIQYSRLGMIEKSHTVSKILHVQVVFLFTLFSIFLSIPFSIFYYIIGFKLLAFVVIFSIAIVGFFLWYLKKTYKAELVAHAVLICLYVILIVASYNLGGFDNPNDAWLIVLPIIGGVLLKKDWFWFYVSLIFVTICGFYFLNLFGHDFPQMLSKEKLDLVSLSNRIGAILVIAILILLFRFERNSQQRSLLKKEKEIYEVANYDSLTKIANRSFFNEKLNQAIKKYPKNKKRIALLFIDLDGFKTVNDTYGHNIGDELLVLVAERIKGQLNSGDIICRQGGDEFLIMPNHAGSDEFIENFADKIIKCLARPFVLPQQVVHIGCSIGIAYFPEHGVNYVELLGSADIAMYRAKQQGSEQYSIFNKEIIKEVNNKNLLALDLRKAINNDDLELHYQSQFSLSKKKTIGFEALLRWTKDDGSIVEPGAFIKIAEEFSLIHKVGEWVISRCCRQIIEWRTQGLEVPPISINVSSRQLIRPGFVSDLLAIISKYGLEASALVLELTESVFIDYSQKTLSKLNKLHDLGFALVIDDYGTGYASLGYLKRFPVSGLKIDKSFIDELATSEQDQTIVKSTITLAHQLGLKIIAEGAEDEKQIELLKWLGCDIVQGYYYGKPTPASEVKLPY